jgi:hypothetical protein
MPLPYNVSALSSKRGTIGGFRLPCRTLHEGGRMLVEQVAGSQWNGWPDANGIRGRITVVRAISGRNLIVWVSLVSKDPLALSDRIKGVPPKK